MRQEGNELNFKAYWKSLDNMAAYLLTKAVPLWLGKGANLLPSLNQFIRDEMDDYTIKPKEEFRVVQGILIGFLMLGTEGTFAVDSALNETAEAMQEQSWLHEYNKLVEQRESHLKAMTQTFRLIFGSKRKQFLDVLKYGASRLANHVSGEEATEFMQSAI